MSFPFASAVARFTGVTPSVVTTSAAVAALASPAPFSLTMPLVRAMSSSFWYDSLVIQPSVVTPAFEM